MTHTPNTIDPVNDVLSEFDAVELEYDALTDGEVSEIFGALVSDYDWD